MSDEERKAKQREYRRAWYRRNADKVKAKVKARNAANPEPQRERVRKWQRENREKHRAAARRSRAKKRDYYNEYSRQRNKLPEVKRRQRSTHLQRLCGITIEQWELAFELQSRACACCGSADPKSKLGWATDHDHQTGQFRGILCGACNKALGYLGNTPEEVKSSLERFAAYLASVPTRCASVRAVDEPSDGPTDETKNRLG